MEMTTEKPDRKKHTYVQSLAAPPEKVFPLLCPAMEKEWVPGWAPIKIITGSGFAEKDCIFVTPAEPNPSIWIVTWHDPAGFALEMYKITGLYRREDRDIPSAERHRDRRKRIL